MKVTFRGFFDGLYLVGGAILWVVKDAIQNIGKPKEEDKKEDTKFNNNKK